MPTEVKICGLCDAESVDAAIEAGADLVGFVFFAPSPRNIDPADAARLVARARGHALVTALLVDPQVDEAAEIAEAVRPDLLQLHGRESAEQVAAICAATGLPVMKALGVATRDDLAGARRTGADRLLLDARPQPGATRPGGNGEAFDWKILAGFASPLPWMLSGGLDAANVAEALRISGAPAVDVSSGVERAPGRKDPRLIHEFVRAVRAAEAPSQRRA